MKMVSTVSRYLLGLMFFVFGLNGFLHFIPQQMPANPLAVQFFTAATASHFMVAVFFLQLLCGVLLVLKRWVPLALTILAGVILNILNYHVTMDPKTIFPGILAAVLWVLVFRQYRPSFTGVLGRNDVTSA
jgi:putative oxidoreductase